jgi:hypothetical protein
MTVPDLYPLPDYPGYSITEDGRVFSHKRNRFITGKPNPRSGYFVAALHIEGIRYDIPVHHLVLSIFEGPRPPGKIGLHKNDDRSDNHKSNLEWGDNKKNAEQAVLNGRLANRPAPPNRRFTLDEVDSIRARVASGEPQKQVALDLEVGATIINNIILRRSYK